jgi:hypothetical protein
MSRIKKYQKFLEEISIMGNPAIPEDYLKGAEQRAKEELGISGLSSGQVGGELMALSKKSQEFCKGKEKELVQLCVDFIEEQYGDILRNYEIDLDIDFVKDGRQVMNFMQKDIKQENENFRENLLEEQDQEPTEENKEKVEEELQKEFSKSKGDMDEVHKRKMANLIIQGEAKNTKPILNMPLIKDGLNRILGAEKGKEYFEICKKIIDLANKLDQLSTPEKRAEQMENNEGGFAGVSGYTWKKEKVQKPKQEEEEEEFGEFFGGDEEEFYGGDEEEFYGGDEEEFYGGDEEDYSDKPIIIKGDEFKYTPTLKARGIDFPMLLHESVKGLWEILSIGGIPEDEETADKAISQTGMSDEPEDWKYGPTIAKDLSIFVRKRLELIERKNPKVSGYKNIKEEFYRILIDKNTMSATEFLALMKGILSNSAEAERKVDSLLNKTIKRIEEWIEYWDAVEAQKQYERDMEQYRKDLEEYNRKMEIWKAQQGAKSEQKPKEVKAQNQVELSIDSILDKISRSGMDSLTQQEKEFLKSGGKK